MSAAPNYDEGTGPDGIAPALEAEGPTGFVQIPDGVLLHDQLDGDAVRLYGLIKRRAGQKGSAWPGRRLMADELRVKSTRTVDKYLGQLIDTGYLVITPRYRTAQWGFPTGDGGRTSNHYLLRWTPVMPEPSGHGDGPNPQVTPPTDGEDPPSKDLLGVAQDFARASASSCQAPEQGFAQQEPQKLEPKEEEDHPAMPDGQFSPTNTRVEELADYPMVALLADELTLAANRYVIWNLLPLQLQDLERHITLVGDVGPFVARALRHDSFHDQPGDTARAYVKDWLRLRPAPERAATGTLDGPATTSVPIPGKASSGKNRQPRTYCGQCDDGWLYDDQERVSRCPCNQRAAAG